MVVWVGLCVLIGLPIWCAVIPVALLVFGWWRWKNWRRAMIAEEFIMLLVMLIWRAFLSPSHHREWASEWENLAVVVKEENEVIVENVRNFSWSEGGVREERWETRKYDLAKLSSLDLWVHPLGGSSLIAHNMLSFGFGGEDYLTVSVEARREQGELFGLVEGEMNQFELIYLFVAEEDTLTKRVLVNGDPLYRYPVKADAEFIRTLLLDLLESARRLHDEPQFYSSLKNNCTTILMDHANKHLERKIGGGLDSVFSGQAPRILKEHGLLLEPLTSPERFRADFLIQQHSNDTEFGRKIRGK